MDSERRELRWGVLAEGTTLPAWQARCVDALTARCGSGPRVLVREARGAGATGAGASLWGWYARRAAARARSLEPTDASAAFAGAAVILRHGSHAFRDEELEAIAAQELDFLLHLSSALPDGKLLEVPRHGVWSFLHGGADGHADAPHLRELDRGDRVTPVTLRRLVVGNPLGEPLHRGFFHVMQQSYGRTLDAAYLGSVPFPALVCEHLLRSGALPTLTAREAPALSTAAAPTPGNREMSAHLGRLAWRKLEGQIGWAFRAEQWNVGVVDAPVASFLEPGFRPRVRWLPTRASNLYLADPFALALGDRLTVFAEDYDHGTEHGHIAFVAEGATGAFEAPVPAIELPEHLSYPYLLVHGGEVYCIPEASAAREVRLFRATSFPREWELARVLVKDFAAVDSTVFEHEGRWWLLCCDEDTGSWTALHAFHAPDLLGPWEPHAGNPVKTDVRSSRPAGKPFVSGGHLYRPAQDCSRTYGGAVAINRVLRLTPTDFAEEVVRVIEPDRNGPFPDGLHTLTAVSDRLTLIDGKRMIFVGEVFRRSLRQRWAGVAARLRRVAGIGGG